MGCATSRPSVAAPSTHQPHLLLSAKDVPALSKLTSANASCSSYSTSSSSSLITSASSGPVTRRKRQSSGLEGRYGFVQPGSRASLDVGSLTRRASMEVSKALPNRRQSLQIARPPTNGRRSLTLSMGTLGEACEHEDDGEDDVELDVPFIFKKALEAKLGFRMTRHNLDHVVQVVTSDLDPHQLGAITTQTLVMYVQSACAAAHLVQPTCQQLQATLPVLALDRKSTLDVSAIRAALLSLDWRLTAGASYYQPDSSNFPAKPAVKRQPPQWVSTAQPSSQTQSAQPSAGQLRPSFSASEQRAAAMLAFAS